MAVFTQQLNDTILEAAAKYLQGPVYGGEFVVPFWDYNDLETHTTPITLAANTWTPLTNDGEGAQTYTDAGEPSLGPVWDVSTQRFDFSSFQPGSMVDLRVDLVSTTETNHTDLQLELVMSEGTLAEFSLPLIPQNSYKTPGEHRIAATTFFYLKDEYTIENPAYLRVKADAASTAVVNGWNIRTFIKV